MNIAHAARGTVESTFNDSDLRLELPRADFQRHGGVVNAPQSSLVAHQCHGDASKYFVHLVLAHITRHVARFQLFWSHGTAEK